MKVALVAGATGTVGSGIIDALRADGGWTILALSRRAKLAHVPSDVITMTADINDRAQLSSALSAHRVTNLFYAALDSGKGDMVVPGHENLVLFRNVVEALVEGNHPLDHILAVHGGKYYGHHLGPNGGWEGYKTVFEEDRPNNRHPDETDFYFLQEDYLKENAPKHGYKWSTLRPTHIFGYAYANNSVWLNPGSAYAIYAVLLKEIGQPLIYPGNAESYNCLYPIVSNQKVGKMAVWTANDPKCAFQSFNSSNEPFRWRDVWPQLGRYFGMESKGPDEDLDVEELLKDRQEIWAKIVKKYDLSEPNLDRVFNLTHLTLQMQLCWDTIYSQEKTRKYGFLEEESAMDTFGEVFGKLEKFKIIPNYNNKKSKL